MPITPFPQPLFGCADKILKSDWDIIYRSEFQSRRMVHLCYVEFSATKSIAVF